MFIYINNIKFIEKIWIFYIIRIRDSLKNAGNCRSMFIKFVLQTHQSYTKIILSETVFKKII